MKIAIDVTPLANTSGHKVRGTGFYIENLRESLIQQFPQHSYHFFTLPEKLSEEYDVIHYPYFEPFFLTLPRNHPACKTVVTVHDVTPLVFPHEFPSGIKGKLRWLLQKNTLARIDSIITDSEASKKDIIRFCNIPENKITVIYLAAGNAYKKLTLSQEKKKELREKYHLPEKFLLYVGDATWNKNLPRLIRAVKKTSIPLVMVGKALAEKNFDRSNPWNKDRIEVEKLITDSTQIIRLGFLPTDDLVAIYNIATVFIMPSIYEGFGLPILEAMSCECPVITTNQGSLPEVAGDAAYYVDAFSETDMTEEIEKLFANTRLQQQLIEKGRAQVRNFSWKKTAAETMNVYET